MKKTRVYLPATVSDLGSSDGLGPTRGYRPVYPQHSPLTSDDEEAAEYTAFLLAAEAAIDEGEVVRIVVAGDVFLPADQVSNPVMVDHLPWSDAVSIHIDDCAEAELLGDINLAQAGDDHARARVNQADLMWYDITERFHVVEMIAAI